MSDELHLMNIRMGPPPPPEDDRLWGNYVDAFPYLLHLEPVREIMEMAKHGCPDEDFSKLEKRYKKALKAANAADEKKFNKATKKLGKELEKIAEAAAPIIESEEHYT